MAKSLKFGNVVLCEYVAKGEKNKYTLINVFSGDVIVVDLPAKLNFGLYMEYLPDAVGPRKLTLSMMLDKKKFGQIVIQIERGAPGTPGVTP